MAAIPKVESIWLDGKFVAWDDAQVHITAHCLHYGTGVFEGVRSYETAKGAAVFRLDAHMKRFKNSAGIYQIDIPYSVNELGQTTLELVARNKLANAYIRPIAFNGVYSLDVWPRDCPVVVAIAAWPRGEYLGRKGIEEGVRVMFSSVPAPCTASPSGSPANNASCTAAFRRADTTVPLLPTLRRAQAGVATPSSLHIQPIRSPCRWRAFGQRSALVSA